MSQSTPSLRDAARSAFFYSLAGALRAGHEPRAVLELLAEDDLDPRLARVARTLAGEGAGKTLPEVLALAPRSFGPAAAEMARAGESSGKLADALELMAADGARSAEMGPRVSLALIFPLIGLGGAFLVALLCAVFVVPAYKEMFVGFGADLPSLTLAYMGISELLASYWYLLIALAVALFFAFAWRSKYAYGRPIDGLLMRLPLLGKHLLRVHSARMAGLLADAVRMEFDARAALAYLRDTCGNRVLGERTEALMKEAGTGTVAAWLAQSRSVPRRLSVAAGAQADPQRLARALAGAAGEYAEAARAGAARIERNTFISAYLIVGLIVGTLVIAMYLPMFKMSSAI